MSGNPDSELLSGQNEYKYHFIHRQLPGSIARESQNRYGQVLSRRASLCLIRSIKGQYFVYKVHTLSLIHI